MLVLEYNGVASSDETSTETHEGEALPQAGKGNKKFVTDEESDKSGDYNISLDMPIALTKGTKSCTKYPCIVSCLTIICLLSLGRSLPTMIQQ